MGPSPSAARAAAFEPSRPVQLLVTFPPGGATDLLARTVAQARPDGRTPCFTTSTTAGWLVGLVRDLGTCSPNAVRAAA